MRLIRFSFRNEAIWITIFSLTIPIIGLLIFLITWFLRSLH